jgi:antirestriction protein ArdC
VSSQSSNRFYHEDLMQMPPFEAFRDAESYYATRAHETSHYAVSWIMPHAREGRWNWTSSMR